MNDLFQNHAAKSGPVECLGQTFPSDEARREHYVKLLAEKLKDPGFREVDGFPEGSDEDILALSDPPYYTACPNPFISDFLNWFGTSYGGEIDTRKTEPFASDVAEGRHTWLYKAHSYHTKVPPKAIQRYIEHYTSPGDVVLDAFCGSGMSGIAASMCNPPRSSIISDLSPAATFISYGHVRNVDPVEVIEFGRTICDQLDSELGWMYEVEGERGQKALANYIVWTDVFLCADCQGEIKFYEAAYDEDAKEMADEFICPHCGSLNSKSRSTRAETTTLDPVLMTPWTHYRQDPVLVAVSTHSRRATKRAAIPSDFALMEKVRNSPVSKSAKRLAIKMLGRDGQWGDQWKNCIHLRPITHAHQFFFPGQLRYLSRLIELMDYKNPIHQAFLFVVSSVLLKSSRLMSYNADGIGRIQKGVLYISSCAQEMRLTHMIRISLEDTGRSVAEGMWRDIPKRRSNLGAGVLVSTGSSTKLPIPDSSIDYVFVDPPFGGNIPYCEVNFLWESLIRVVTAKEPEAVESKIQLKTHREYQALMFESFKELNRVLKPGRWMTVEFSNTKASVWNAIQTAIQEAGFVVANVSALSKKQGSFKAVTTTTAVKQDLVISAYKPDQDLEESLTQSNGSPEAVWDFIRAHLGYLPVVKTRSDAMEYIPERDPRILFDRTVSWFVRHGYLVPISAPEFQEGLRAKFFERDGMFFLPEQIVEYEKARMKVAEAPQMEMFVSDERSAIDWLADFLKRRPSTYQEIHPEFIGQLGAGWKKHEAKPELSALLEDNFLKYDGTGEVPSQIHSYLSTNHKDLRGQGKNSLALMAKAKDRWYVPDPNKAQDLEKKREKALLKEFETYKAFTGRKIKESRLEVLRVGFRAAWAAKDYQTIIRIANKLPEDTLQEDEKLLTLYDLALTRTEDGI
ncbi:site-specific DNA-methyltransferase [Acidithiobacillus ferrooxidans]|nr:site-specific DNA-methyltransferase [Acidithiobacillus ferrooxidans]